MRQKRREPTPLRDVRDLAAIYVFYNGGSVFLRAEGDAEEDWLRREAAMRNDEVLPKFVYVERRPIRNPEAHGRPALERLVQDARVGAFGAVFIKHPSHLTDSHMDAPGQEAALRPILEVCRVFVGPTTRARMAIGFDEHQREGELQRIDVATEIERVYLDQRGENWKVGLPR